MTSTPTAIAETSFQQVGRPRCRGVCGGTAGSCWSALEYVGGVPRPRGPSQVLQPRSLATQHAVRPVEGSGRLPSLQPATGGLPEAEDEDEVQREPLPRDPGVEHKDTPCRGNRSSTGRGPGTRSGQGRGTNANSMQLVVHDSRLDGCTLASGFVVVTDTAERYRCAAPCSVLLWAKAVDREVHEAGCLGGALRAVRCPPQAAEQHDHVDGVDAGAYLAGLDAGVQESLDGGGDGGQEALTTSWAAAECSASPSPCLMRT